MRGGDHFYPGVQFAAWNVTEGKLRQIYFSATFLKLLATSILQSDNCNQLPFNLPRLLRGNTSPI